LGSDIFIIVVTSKPAQTGERFIDCHTNIW